MRLPPPFTTTRLLGATAAAAAATLVLALGLAAASPAPAPASVAIAAGPPQCASSGLVVWLDTNGDGTAGSIYYKLHFTNLSGHACTLKGYPGVSAVNLTGHQLGSAATRDAANTPHRVKLAAGATATAVLRIVDAGNFTSSACGEVSAAGLRVFPPNQTASKRVPFPFFACSHTGPIYLTVRAVHH